MVKTNTWHTSNNCIVTELSSEKLHLIIELFYSSPSSNFIPASWANINLRMIHKKGSKKDPSNNHPIALVNAITKIFTQIAYNRLTKWTKEYDKLPEWQSGCRASRSCIDNIFVLIATIQIHLARPKAKLFALFVDFSRAFDSIVHSILWEKIHLLGF